LQETVNLNIFWSQFFWDFCTVNRIPLIYASSAATYGNGDHGFSDEMSLEDLGVIPMKGLYSWSKMFFDIFAMKQTLINNCPPKWYGLKFFNVYGANELHKGSQSSVIHPFLEQLTNNGTVSLFKSYLDGVNDGYQQRDFISVNYCINFIRELTLLNSVSGIYNVGTGHPKTFLNFADDMMKASNISGEVKFIEMPKSLKPHYQYFTKSENIKSREIHSAINGFDYMEDLRDIIRTLQNERT
jgi:ADP-L-glycero-D-manno-heptose 6-epimerase